jgi:hypothetical protein
MKRRLRQTTNWAYDNPGQVTSGKHFWQDSTPVASQPHEYALNDNGNREAAGRGGDQECIPNPGTLSRENRPPGSVRGARGKGQGVEKDEAEAVKWYRKAAEQNNAGAQNNLGSRYANGQGVEKDLVEAYKWTLLAVGQGNENAKEHMTPLQRSMTPEQIAEGKRRANDWRKQHSFMPR